jgi:hypothetical protein
MKVKDLTKLRLHRTRKIRKNKDWGLYDMKLKISLIPYLKMYYYTRAAKGEISGLGKIKIINDEIAIVTRALIFEQECSSAYTELNEDMLAKFVVDLVKKNEDPQNWKLWWHSHNDFSVGWSSVDEDCIKHLSKDTVLFSICINKDGDMIARVDENGNTQELSIAILPTGYIDLRETCKKEVERKVKIVEPEYEIVNIMNEKTLYPSHRIIFPVENDAIVVNGEVLTAKEMEKKYGLSSTIFYD